MDCPDEMNYVPGSYKPNTTTNNISQLNQSNVILPDAPDFDQQTPPMVPDILPGQQPKPKQKQIQRKGKKSKNPSLV